MVGIIGYGAYIPRNRIKVEEIAKVWGADAPSYKKGLLVEEKSVPSPDQDTITMSVEASKNALKRAGIDPREIGAVYVGSESHPYAVKPSGTVLAEALGATPEVHTADLEFACKAGTEGMFIALGLVESRRSQVRAWPWARTPPRERPATPSSTRPPPAPRPIIFGRDAVVAECLETYSFTTDTPDFWRREYQYYPHHGGRFTGEPGLFQTHHGRRQGDHGQGRVRPGRFPIRHLPPAERQVPVPRRGDAGVQEAQIEPGWLVHKLGNTYSGSSPLGLTATLDIAKPGDKILLVSYGSGAGSDAFIFRVTAGSTRSGTSRPRRASSSRKTRFTSSTGHTPSSAARSGRRSRR